MSDGPKIYLIRHGEAANNVQANMIGGQALGAPLTDEGNQQSCNLGMDLRRIGLIPDAVYSSTATRAVETGQQVLATMGLKIDLQRDERLLEQHTGDWTGRVATEIFTDQQVAEIEKLGKDFRPPNGESMNDVGERMYSWLNSVGESGDEDSIIAFTHGGAIRALASYLEGWSHSKTYNTRPNNTSLSIFRKKDDIWVPEQIGLESHELDVEIIDPIELSFKLSENELVREHLESVIWFGSQKNKQDVHARSDFDVQIVLDKPSTELVLELNKILQNYPNIDLSIMYMKDIIDNNGDIIFHDGTKGTFFMQVLAEGKILYGSNIYADLVSSLDLDAIKPSVITTIREYASRLRVMAALSPKDTQEFKKYSLKLFKDVLLYDGTIDLSKITKLNNETAARLIAERYKMSSDSKQALGMITDYEHIFTQSQTALLLTDYECIVEKLCNE